MPDTGPSRASSTLQPDLALHRLPGHLIRRLQQISVSLVLDEIQDFGITPVQLGTLLAIEEVPGLDAMDLSRLIALDRSTIGDVVSRLEQRHLVERRRGSTDRRTKRLFLTDAGRDLVAELSVRNERAQARILDCLDEAERARFMELLTKLVSHNNASSRAPMQEAVRLQATS